MSGKISAASFLYRQESLLTSTKHRFRNGRGAIESTGTTNANIPYLTMTGNPYFGLLFHGTRGLKLGKITMNLSGGMGIRFHRDEAHNYDVTMDDIRVTGAGSHAVETWNIDGLKIGQVIARDVGECGLLLQKVTNAQVGLVDGYNVAAGTGYATLRFANENGKLANGQYTHNIFIDKVVSRGGGRGLFCVSQSGGAVINNFDTANNGGNAVLLENCYNILIKSGKVQGGGEVRLAARTEFANNRDLTIALEVSGTTVRESPCGTNIKWYLTGSGSRNICGTNNSGSPGGPSAPTTTRPPTATTTRPPTATTTTRPPTTTTASGGAGAPLYGQCGGEGYTGPKSTFPLYCFVFVPSKILTLPPKSLRTGQMHVQQPVVLSVLVDTRLEM